VVMDTTSGGFSVVPNPGRRFGGEGVDRVYFYFEGYGLDPAADSYEVVTRVLSPEADTLVSTGPQVKPRSGTDVSSALGVSVARLDPGEYQLELELSDRHGGSVRRRAGFRVSGAAEEPGDETPYRLNLTPLEKKYYNRLEYVATATELAYYNALSDSGKEAYLAWFWSRHNLSEFVRRMETANERYRTSTAGGLDTDRGRIYVKYGEPDEVERKVLEVHVRPREYWQYYNQGYVFIFIDITGTDNYRLAWTNSPHETRTGYEGLLTPEEEELYR
jgi:GWxTD domain-containing protein